MVCSILWNDMEEMCHELFWNIKLSMYHKCGVYTITRKMNPKTKYHYVFSLKIASKLLTIASYSVYKHREIT